MKILLINYEYPPIGGGGGRATQSLAEHFVQAGHQVIVLTTAFREKRGWTEEKGVHVLRIRSMRKRMDRSSLFEMASFCLLGFLSLWKFRKLQIGSSIAFFTFPSGPIAWAGKWFLGVPYLISLRGGDVPGAEPSLNRIHRMIQPLRRMILNQSEGVVANSQGLKKLAEATDPIQCQLIPNGIDSRFFIPKSRFSKGPLVLLFVGRFQSQKNLKWLFRTLYSFRDRVCLKMVGDGPLKKDLVQLANALGIGENILWFPWSKEREKILQHYCSSDVLINCSHYEGMSNVMLEAMACGLPVLASRVIGNEELVSHGENGYLFEPGNQNEFGEFLSKMFDRERNQKMGAYSRKKALEYSLENVGQNYLNLLSPPVEGIS